MGDIFHYDSRVQVIRLTSGSRQLSCEEEAMRAREALNGKAIMGNQPAAGGAMALPSGYLT